jgi:tRNA (mo5U34)-methyltransferase
MNGAENAALRAEAAALPWLQSIRLGPDLVTPGLKSELALQAEEAALLDPLPLAGGTLLEIGAANGYFSLAALRRGAAGAVVTDHLAWDLPGMQGNAATALAIRALGVPAQAMVLDPRALTAEFGRFDVVLATAFFEQLFNPILALRGMAAVTGDVLMLETLEAALEEPRPMLTATLLPMPYGAIVAGWAPNPPLMAHLLPELGFDRILHRPHPIEGAGRGLYAALKPEAPAALLERFGTPWRRLTPAA